MTFFTLWQCQRFTMGIPYMEPRSEHLHQHTHQGMLKVARLLFPLETP